jgi:hypothetical protein
MDEITTQMRYYFSKQGWSIQTFANLTGLETRRLRSILHAGAPPTFPELAIISRSLNCEIVLMPRPKPADNGVLRSKYLT